VCLVPPCSLVAAEGDTARKAKQIAPEDNSFGAASDFSRRTEYPYVSSDAEEMNPDLLTAVRDAHTRDMVVQIPGPSHPQALPLPVGGCWRSG
jgi:hypothetical protein